MYICGLVIPVPSEQMGAYRTPLKWQPTNNVLRGSVVGHQAENADQAHANCLTARLDLARRPRHRLALIA